jgi:glycosyltransferase involved in cell wall biosynthesis
LRGAFAKTMPSPKISVIMPIYNGERYLSEAIESTLNQTFSDFEFLILDDGSTDRSSSIISGYNDPRIKVFSHANRGLAATLNRGIALAAGKYIARQDQDDLSLPERFERQITFLENNPRVGMVGTWAKIFEGSDETSRVHDHPAKNYLLKFDLMFNNPFVHSSVMIRKTVLEQVGGYSTDKSRQPPEDYELWSRIARISDVANIPEVLHVYREVPHSMSRDGLNPFLERVVRISSENIAWVLGKEEPDESIGDISAIVHSARHILSPRPSFSRMSAYLGNAVDNLLLLPDADRVLLYERTSHILGAIRHVCESHVRKGVVPDARRRLSVFLSTFYRVMAGK